MSNITLAIDDATLTLGRRYANETGISFNALVRQLVEQTVKRFDTQQWLDDTLGLLAQAQGNSQGKKWAREELYEP